MRVALLGTVFVASAAAASACAHEATRPVRAAPPESQDRYVAPSGPVQYVVADPSARRASTILALGTSGSYGLTVDKMRLVMSDKRGEPRVAPDTTDTAILGAAKIPGRFGGGFLFWTDRGLYRAESFDAPLRPIVRVPDTVVTVAFASKFLLVRTQNGERWGIALPSGERRAIEPLGVADVEALDDGRALAFDDQGSAFASTDGGDHFADVTAQIKSSPIRVASIEGELWIFESSGAAVRLEPDGHLAAFDKQPAEKPASIRPRDPSWRGQEAPLRAAFRSGAAIDDMTAIVLEGGDLVRIDVHTGEILSAVTGQLPPGAQCDAVPVHGDVLFACATRSSSGSSAFVVSQTIGGDTPVVEHTFSGAGHFWAGDDGGLAFGGPCGESATTSPIQDETVCVRQPGGTWQERDASGLSIDAGPSGPRVVRWVPRADGRAVAFVDGTTPGIYDPQTGHLVALPDEIREVLGRRYAPPPNGRHRKPFTHSSEGPPIDTSWSFTPAGTLRGWQRHGGMVEITDDGRLHHSPYTFDVLAAGRYALGRTADGRLYQSSDHGGTWAEIDAPPSGAAAIEMRSCTSAGCDLGAFYRVGWEARPPRIEPPLAEAPDAPEVRRARALELSCRPLAGPVTKVIARTDSSPDDLGLGASRLPVAGERGTYAYLRNVVPRGISNPLHDSGGSDADSEEIRAILSGYQTERQADTLEVMGPNKSIHALRRPLAYVAAFDPTAKISRTSIAMSEVIAVGRGAGMTTDEILEEDMTEGGNIIVMTPTSAHAPSDIAFHNPRGLLAFVRNDRARLAMRASQNDATVISGVSLGADEAAFLEVEPDGIAHVFRMGVGGVTDLFDLSPTVNDTGYFPANPDAVAVGPKSEIGVVRTASGSDPSSAWDPAFVIVPSTPLTALAPWSQLHLADDPVCSDPGWRTTLQIIAPWVRLATPDFRIEEVPMLARVKWNDKRVCVEGIEARLPPVTIRSPKPALNGEPITVATWLVSNGSTFARVGVADGVEWRQPLECSIVSAAKTAASP